MLTLPPITPNFVRNRLPAEHSVSRFRSDAGLDTVVSMGGRGFGVSFQLIYSKLEPVELALLLKFWQTIGGSSAGSRKAFVIPESHSALGLVREWMVLRDQVIFDSQGLSWWIVTDRSPYDGDLCYAMDWTWTVENVWRRN